MDALMSITKRKRKDGSTVYDVTLEYGTIDGKRDRRKRTFPTLKDAQAAERDAERLRGAMRHQGRLKLGEYIARYYWPIASRRLQATSQDTYRREIDKRILPILGDCFLEELDRLKIQRLVDSCPTEAVGRKCHGVLKTILNEAVGDGFIISNPALARYAMPPKGNKRDNGLILGDFPTIREYVETVRRDAPPAIQRLVVSGLLLGLRPEERYALDWEDIGMTTVSVTKAYVIAKGGPVLKETKTQGSNRVIPFSPDFFQFMVSQSRLTGPWIVGRDGERLSPSTGRKMWTRYLDAHPELERITLENMRHSFATACLKAGMNVEDVSRMLGHADINTTYRRYVKPNMQNMRDGLKKTWSHG